MPADPLRRNTSAVGSGSASPHRGQVKFLSPALLNLERVHEQNLQRIQKRDGAGKQPELIPELPAKGKPRLMLMGQRRYGKQVVFYCLTCG